MAEALEEESGVRETKEDLLLPLSVDPGEQKADCCYTFRTPVGPLHLIYIIDEAAQTKIFLFFFQRESF